MRSGVESDGASTSPSSIQRFRDQMPLRRAKAEEQKQRRVTLNAKKHYFWEGFEGDVDNANKGESG